ncbi:MAG: penicillin-binding protein activator LpoB [Nitrospirota bacterium]
MNRSLTRCLYMFLIIGCLIVSAGCTVSTRTVAPDEELHYDEAYDFSDKKVIVDKLINSLVTKQPLAGAADRPVIIVYGVANRTSEHISTSGITDDIRQGLLESGKARLINETQRENIARETEYQQSGNVLTETRIARARQIGAKYMLTGTLRSIEKKEPRQVRLKKKSLQYYSLNLELTDIETSLIEWTDKVEVIREASKPFIGW